MVRREEEEEGFIAKSDECPEKEEEGVPSCTQGKCNIPPLPL